MRIASWISFLLAISLFEGMLSRISSRPDPFSKPLIIWIPDLPKISERN